MLFSGHLLCAQENRTVRGIVYDTGNTAPLEGASIVDLANGKGTVSGSDGAFELTIGMERTALQVSFLGYLTIDTIIGKELADPLIFVMIPEPVQYDEVQIVAADGRDFVGSVRMGDVHLSRQEFNNLPKLLGEADPIRFLQLTPGVQSGTEGGIGFFVRGGSVDQNLVLYDDAPIYNPGHLLGFISVFNPDIITGVSLIKSGIPARFGGRLSSVIQVNPDRGRSDSLRIKGQVGLVASRISVNRSFANDKGSFILSGRTASIDLFVKPVVFPLLADANPFLKQSSYNFYDMNLGLAYRIGKKDFISFSAFYGEDSYGITRSERIAETNMDWGNFILSGRWNHVFSENLVLATTLSQTNYHFDLSGAQSEYIFSLLSAVKDYSLKSRLSYFNSNHQMTFGYEFARHQFIPNDIDVSAGGLIMNFLSYNRLFAYEGGIYAEDEFQLNDRLGISAGLRYSFFAQTGPYTEYLYDESSLLKDSLLYPSGEVLAFYHHPEPRISARYNLNSNASVKASYMHMAQYVHMATSSTVSLPTDIWLPSSREIKPQYGDQVSAGYFFDWLEGTMESSVELYYKSSRNQLEFIRGVISNSLNLTIDDNLAIGKGRSYGAEFFLRKRSGVLTGWAGYTISRAERQFDMINDGRVYPAKFDRRHDISLAGNYSTGGRWNLSMVFIYVSGNAFTLPIGRYVIEGNLINQYGKVNNYRMPDYHRLDLSATRTVTTRAGNLSSWDFSVYNLYNRANPFYIYFETNGDPDSYQLEVKPVIVSLFPIVPSVSWRFEF